MTNFLKYIKGNPETVTFSEVIAFIDANFDFKPSSFINGSTKNEAGQNNGSCKVFGFAKFNKLTKEETLSCFGDYYRKDVLQNPQGEDHQNIRNFMENGWEGVKFDSEPLKLKM